MTSGRVRAGYRIGERLFAGLPGRRAILHVIGERPGTGHDTFSVYMTCPHGERWGRAGTVDHDVTRVVAGIARTALAPALGRGDGGPDPARPVGGRDEVTRPGAGMPRAASRRWPIRPALPAGVGGSVQRRPGCWLEASRSGEVQPISRAVTGPTPRSSREEGGLPVPGDTGTSPTIHSACSCG